MKLLLLLLFQQFPLGYSPMPLIDLQIHERIKKMNMPTELFVQQYMQEYYSVLQVFTDGSKEPESGRTAAEVYIPTFKIKIAKRLSDHVSVFTTELLSYSLYSGLKKFNQREL